MIITRPNNHPDHSAKKNNLLFWLEIVSIFFTAFLAVFLGALFIGVGFIYFFPAVAAFVGVTTATLAGAIMFWSTGGGPIVAGQIQTIKMKK